MPGFVGVLALFEKSYNIQTFCDASAFFAQGFCKGCGGLHTLDKNFKI